MQQAVSDLWQRQIWEVCEMQTIRCSDAPLAWETTTLTRMRFGPSKQYAEWVNHTWNPLQISFLRHTPLLRVCPFLVPDTFPYGKYNAVKLPSIWFVEKHLWKSFYYISLIILPIQTSLCQSSPRMWTLRNDHLY